MWVLSITKLWIDFIDYTSQLPTYTSQIKITEIILKNDDKHAENNTSLTKSC